MSRVKFIAFFAGLIILTACVTINIYFPAAEAREAAEKIVDDILSEEQDQSAPATPEQSRRALEIESGYVFNPLNVLIPAAQAAGQPKFDVSSPAVRKLQAAMKKRHASLKGFYKSGAIGFTQDAMVGVRELSAVPLKQRGQLKNLVNAENTDRNQLYQEIARANGHPEWEKDIRATFGKTWVNNAQQGWWYQNEKGAWVQK
ncbi:MAG: YdbL family protein [Gammaproteobacteria bacterium]|nr:YdbL family protein [Gammaproteobacteria bacterium]